MHSYSSRRKSSQALLEDHHHSHSPSTPAYSAMRNWPLFLFLSALVFFFYVFYIYQATSTELSMAREHLEVQYKQQRVLKDELIDVKSELEKARGNAKTVQESLDATNVKMEECASSLRTVQMRQNSLTEEKTAVDVALKERQSETDLANNKLGELKSKYESLQLLYDSQLKLVEQLNTTIKVLQTDLANKGVGVDGGVRAHSLSPAVSLAPAAGVAAAAAQPTQPPQSSSVPVAGAVNAVPQQQPPPVNSSTVKSGGANLGELIKQDKAEEEGKAIEKRAEDVENGEKPAAEDKEKDELKADAEEEKNENEVVAEERMDEKGVVEVPGRAGDRVKMEEGLMEAEKKRDSQGVPDDALDEKEAKEAVVAVDASNRK